jgi:hypothetical protein
MTTTTRRAIMAGALASTGNLLPVAAAPADADLLAIGESIKSLLPGLYEAMLADYDTWAAHHDPLWSMAAAALALPATTLVGIAVHCMAELIQDELGMGVIEDTDHPFLWEIVRVAGYPVPKWVGRDRRFF